MTTTKVQAARIYFLDYARIFAFSSVLVGHLFSEDLTRIYTDTELHIFFRALAEGLNHLCRFGGAGVVVFFMTSGYIISHVLQEETTLDFLIRRIFRIYPLFMFAILSEMLLLSVTQNTPFPPLQEILPRLLLVGDFTGTPYGLGGVEWTLRVEVAFYVFMALLKASGVLRLHTKLPIFLLLISLLVFYLPAFPNSFGWTDGYFNIFFPFLLIGILFQRHEAGHLKTNYFHIFVGVIFVMTLLKSQALQAKLNSSNFELFALVIFYGLWRFREHLNGNFLVKTLSEMTYAVYLFHLWSWETLGVLVEKYGVAFLPNRLQRLILLFAFCLLAAKTVEKYGIKLGRAISRNYTGKAK